MTARDGLRERWVREVLRADYIGDACKVLLLAMANKMSDHGHVTIQRHVLAEMLGKHERRISERLSEACAAGLLDRRGGFRGMTTEYTAYLPTGKGAAHPHPITRMGAGERHPKSAPIKRTFDPGKGAAEQHPIRARDLDKSAATPNPQATVRALDVALRSGCYQCQLLSYQDETNPPCTQHRRAVG